LGGVEEEKPGEDGSCGKDELRGEWNEESCGVYDDEKDFER